MTLSVPDSMPFLLYPVVGSEWGFCQWQPAGKGAEDTPFFGV